MPGHEDDLKDFIREITLRHEQASRNTERWLRIADRRTDEMIRRSDFVLEELRDLREESRAQTAALFQILDRMGPGGAQPA
ncbi:MAG: hypothetical protein U0R24_10315 [Solirubrobacterales bacterium]